MGMEFGPFYAGALHVVTGLDYLAALVAVAILSALQPRAIGAWSLPAVPVSMLFGAFGARFGAAMQTADALVLLAVLGAGLACALGLRLERGSLVLASIATGAALGYANGIAGRATDLLLFSGGVAAAGGLVIVFATALLRAAADRGPIPVIGCRIVGSWMAALGLIVIGAELAGLA